MKLEFDSTVLYFGVRNFYNDEFKKDYPTLDNILEIIMYVFVLLLASIGETILLPFEFLAAIKIRRE